MNTAALTELIANWIIVNGAALLVLLVMSFVCGAAALEALAWLDRWLYASHYERRPAAAAAGPSAPQTPLPIDRQAGVGSGPVSERPRSTPA